MRWMRYVACLALSGIWSGCGSAASSDVADAAPTAQALMFDDFGPAFAATMAWEKYAKSADGGCADAVAQVNEARLGVTNTVEWSGVTSLNAWDETNMAWGQYWHEGCSSIGKAPDAKASTPLPTKCTGLTQGLASNWAVVQSTAAYQGLVSDGSMGTLESAFSAAFSAGCVY